MPQRKIKQETIPAAGYSATPLWKKLGYKPGMTAHLLDAPAEYLSLVAPLPQGVVFEPKLTKDLELIHVFTTERAELAKRLPELMKSLAAGGMIWVSWPKKAAKVMTDVTEDVIREVALPLGLVDVKVCAVDAVWSGLKLLRRRGETHTISA